MNPKSCSPSLPFSPLALLSVLGYSLLTLLMLTGSPVVYGQKKVEVAKPELSFEQGKLMILYTIAGGNPGDAFNVSLEISDSTGARIFPRSVKGDIGGGIAGNGQKQIIWDLTADRVNISKGVAVEVFVTRLETPIPKEEEEKSAHGSTEKQPPASLPDKPDNAGKVGNYGSTGSASLGKNLLLSAALPGLGLSRLQGGKPYWIIGAAGYACLASSICLNRMAVSNYTRYVESYDPLEQDIYFGKGEMQYTASKILGWSSAVIWVADLGLTYAMSLRKPQYSRNSLPGAFSLGMHYNYENQAQSFSLSYSF